MANDKRVPKRAFGVTLARDSTFARQGYTGIKGNVLVDLWERGDSLWLSSMTITSLGCSHTIETTVASASPAASIRNLRGTVANLAIDLHRALSVRAK